MTLNSDLHCGACQLPMASNAELTAHLASCQAASNMILPITALMLGAKDQTHFAGYLSQSMSKYAYTIRDYAYAISSEMSSSERSKYHQIMCDKLGLEYSEFRPFESEDIHEIPTQAEAEKIIYEALGNVMKETLFYPTKETLNKKRKYK